MFLQIASPEAKALNIREHWKHQIANCGHKAFELLVKRVLPEFIIQIPDQMNKAFLLLTEQSVVSTVEIGDDRAIEIRKHRSQELRLATWSQPKYHTAAVGKHPDVLIVARDAHLCFVEVHNRTLHQLTQ